MLETRDAIEAKNACIIQPSFAVSATHASVWDRSVNVDESLNKALADRFEQLENLVFQSFKSVFAQFAIKRFQDCRAVSVV